jgi:hypothetical protein
MDTLSCQENAEYEVTLNNLQLDKVVVSYQFTSYGKNLIRNNMHSDVQPGEGLYDQGGEERQVQHPAPGQCGQQSVLEAILAKKKVHKVPKNYITTVKSAKAVLLQHCY